MHDIETQPIVTGASLNQDFAALLMADRVSEFRPLSLIIRSPALQQFVNGQEFTVMARNCADICSFLEENFKGFRQWVREQESFGNFLQFKIDGKFADLSKLFLGVRAEVEIVDVVSAAGGGFGRILLGGALIGAAFIPGLPVLAIGASKIALASVALSLGVSLVLGGLATLLTPQKNNTAGTSTSLGGALSRSPQGRPFPILVGECYVPLSEVGIVLSAGIDVKDVPVNGSGGKGKGK